MAKRKLPVGMYEVNIKGRKTPLIVQFHAVPLGHVVKLDRNKTPETIPEVGHLKYYIANMRLGIYTCIGADNVHHASNKATKLFGPDGWSFLRNEYQTSPSLDGFEAKPYKEFKELIKTLPN